MNQDETDATAATRIQSTYSFTKQLHQMGGGAMSSALTRLFCQPLEVLKIRFQLQVEPLKDVEHQTSKYTSFRQACRMIYRDEGILAFWKGHNAGQFLSIVYGTAQFWSYEQILLQLAQPGLLPERQHVNRFLSGAGSGFVATLVSMPFDVIRTRLVSQDSGAGYRSATSALPSIWNEEGPRGLYRGLGTALIQVVPLVGANFAFYGLMKDLGVMVSSAKSHKELPTWYLLFSGGATGAIVKMAMYPLDLIKRRLQVQGFHEHRKTYGKNLSCDGITSCIRLTLREEGLFGFYKGMYPTLLKSGVSTAFYFGVYDKIKQFF